MIASPNRLSSRTYIIADRYYCRAVYFYLFIFFRFTEFIHDDDEDGRELAAGEMTYLFRPDDDDDDDAIMIIGRDHDNNGSPYPKKNTDANMNEK